MGLLAVGFTIGCCHGQRSHPTVSSECHADPPSSCSLFPPSPRHLPHCFPLLCVVSPASSSSSCPSSCACSSSRPFSCSSSARPSCSCSSFFPTCPPLISPLLCLLVSSPLSSSLSHLSSFLLSFSCFSTSIS